MGERVTYSEETKAAVMAALLTGQSVSEIAREYKIPPATVRSWKSRQASGEGVAKIATQKKERIGDLLLDYLTTSLVSLKKQAEVFGEKDWLEQQPAHELAVLHGVIADKAVRLLEALAQPEEDESQD